MTYTIQNEFLTVTANDKGAELDSIKSGEVEYLWHGNPEIWKYKAPILFPIVGKLKGGAMLYDGNKYIMKNHGICKESIFTLVEHTADSVTFSLTSSEELKHLYPFDFELIVTHKLTGKTLATNLKVTNKSAVEIFFSIGGHPTFNCPLDPNETFEDYEIILNEKETQGTRLLSQDGLISNKTMPFFNETSTIPLDYTHYQKLGILVFKNLHSTEAVLRSKKSDISVSLGFSGFQYFAVWTKSKAPFIALEPWHGICDSSFYNGNFRGKTGTIQLPPNEVYNCGFTITPNP